MHQPLPDNCGSCIALQQKLARFKEINEVHTQTIQKLNEKLQAFQSEAEISQTKLNDKIKQKDQEILSLQQTIKDLIDHLNDPQEIPNEIIEIDTTLQQLDIEEIPADTPQQNDDTKPQYQEENEAIQINKTSQQLDIEEIRADTPQQNDELSQVDTTQRSDTIIEQDNELIQIEASIQVQFQQPQIISNKKKNRFHP